MKNLKQRTLIWTGLALGILFALIYAFHRPPIQVDSALVQRGEFQITIEEEGRTRVANRYQVTAPVSGYISRVRLQPGDTVEAGDPLFTVDANPLDPRSRAQAQAMLARANAALEAARTQVEAEQARAELAETELQRLRRLEKAGHASVDALDRAQTEARRANASLRSTQFAVEVARFERANAQAALALDPNDHSAPMTVVAPVDGTVLTRLRESEGPVQAGEPIVVLGDLASLEVEVDVLSPDAVRLRPGMRVALERWGGDHPLPAQVRRVEPAGFTRYSALGVEEQRVWVIVDLAAERAAWSTLGDGYRVEAHFVIWEGEDVLQVPASALFREGDAWAAYVIKDGEAVKRTVVPGRRSGLAVEVKEGLTAGEVVVLHPGEEIEAGVEVKAR